MKTINSNIAKHVTKSVNSDLGDLYFFNHIAIVEFCEGIHVDINNVKEFLSETINHFGTQRPFGLIANRVNSYSISLMDLNLFKSKLENLSNYGVVGNCTASKMNAEIENSFCKAKSINYNTLYEAVDTIYSKVKSEIEISLNQATK